MKDSALLNLQKKKRGCGNKISQKISKNNCKKLVSYSKKIFNKIKYFIKDYILDDSIMLLIWLSMGATIVTGIYIIASCL